MALFEREDVSLYYEEHGSGFPVLLFAPGGMRSAIDFWQRSPWNPIEALSAQFRVIALDQRNAGRSRAPVARGDGWHSYTEDHVALLDFLGIERCHVLGGCIGGSYCLGMAVRVPDRVGAAVLQQPIGSTAANRQAYYDMFDAWAADLKSRRREMDEPGWREFRERMYGGDFVFNVTRAEVARCRVPLLVLMGKDLYHPEETSREIARLALLAPEVELVERWKDPDVIPGTIDRVIAFLSRHTPPGSR